MSYVSMESSRFIFSLHEDTKSQTFPQHTLIMNNWLIFSFRQNFDLINENSLAHRVCVCTGS